MRDDRERLRDILEAIEHIEKYLPDSEAAFQGDDLIQNWMVRHLQILGEAAYQLSQAVQSRFSQVPWRKIVGMRHVLVHNYFDIDLDTVWSAVANDVPLLKPQIEAILRELDAEHPSANS